MPGAAAAIIDAWACLPKACDSGRGMVHGNRYKYLLDDEDAKLPLSEDPTSSHDSEAGTWRPTAQPQAIPGAAKGVPCMADELELQAEEIEEQDPWAAEDDGGINGSVSSLDSCALSGTAPPAPLQPAWAVAADSARMEVSGGSIVRKPAPSPFTSSDGGWGDNIPVCTTPVIGVRPRAAQQQRQAGEPSRQAGPQAQSALAAPGRQWLRPLVQQPASQWRGCQKGPRCDRENRHRGICNTRAVPPSSFVQQALLCGDGSADGMEGEALVPGTPVAQHSGLYRADAAYLQSPLRGPDNSMQRLSPPRPAGAASPLPAVRQSQRRLKMVAAAQEEHDSASHGSDDDAFARRSLSSRPSSSEVLSGSTDGDFSDEFPDDDDEESQSMPCPHPPAPQHEARTYRPLVAAAKRAATEDLLDLVPPPKLPRSASASSVSPKQQQQQQQPPAYLHAAGVCGNGGRGPRDAPKAGRRPASGRAAVAAVRTRKRAAGGRGTGPPAATLPGQHCSSCHTQVTPVWRAGPLGPKTLCNACGVRYMKTVKPRR